MTRPLRFGIVCRGPTLPAWEAQAVLGLLRVPDVLPALRVDPGTESAEKSWAPFLYRAASRPRPPRSQRPVDLSPSLVGVPSVTLQSQAPGRPSPENELSDLRRVLESDLDFILTFGSGAECGGLVSAARLGVWAFRCAGGDADLSHLPGFLETFAGEHAMGAALVRLAEHPRAYTVLRGGFFRTDVRSYAGTLDALRFGAAEWPAQVCRDLRAGCADTSGPPVSLVARPSPVPTNGDVARLFGREIGRTLRDAYRGLVQHDDWTIGVVSAPIHAFLEPDFRPEITWLRPPAGPRFVADPFGIEVDGALEIIYEDFDYRTGRGTIAAVRADATAWSRSPRVAIELDVPASYPYVFHDGPDVYCIPETRDAREVSLYRALAFPSRWAKVGTILRGVAAVDSTVFPHAGRWWLLCTDQEAGENLRLYAWHAPRLEGPWEPHAANPVKTDVRSARPGGTPFTHGGALYRPAQDCSRTYGGRIVINRVDRLTPTSFSEETVATFGPLSGTAFPEGVHTLSAAGGRTLLDGKRYRFIPRALPYVIRRGLAGARP